MIFIIIDKIKFLMFSLNDMLFYTFSNCCVCLSRMGVMGLFLELDCGSKFLLLR